MYYRFRDASHPLAQDTDGLAYEITFALDEGRLDLELGREGLVCLGALLQVLAAADEGLAEEMQETALEIAHEIADSD